MSNGFPGDGLLQFLARFMSEDRLRDFVIPTLADLQHEVAEAEGNGARRRQACLRGYVALVRILVVPHPSFRSACRQLLAANGVKYMRNVALVGVGLCLVVVVAGIVQANRPIELPRVQQPGVSVPTSGGMTVVRVASGRTTLANSAPSTQTPPLTPAQVQENWMRQAEARERLSEPPVIDPDAPTVTVLDFDKRVTFGEPMHFKVAITGSVPVINVVVALRRTEAAESRVFVVSRPPVGADARPVTAFDIVPKCLGNCDISVGVVDAKGRMARWVAGTVVVTPAGGNLTTAATPSDSRK